VKVLATELPGVLLLEPPAFEDARGLAYEAYNRRTFRAATGVDAEFVQDNRSRSRRDVLRGLHYQVGRPQGKLISVLRGEIFDVAVDLRRSSPRFGKWVGFTLSAADRRMLWIPRGFAHGFLALSESAEVQYKLDDFWSPPHERTIAWDDAEIGVRWPLARAPILSDKDRRGAALRSAEVFD
jgi:dTDP-4-dehydrorhamnose 3,5-epimerase